MDQAKTWDRNGLAALLVAALLWTLGIVNRSLWIDEFHTLEHARTEGFPQFLDSLATGNHPPLSTALVRWSAQWFGESEWAIRAWSVLVGLLVMVLTVRIARRLPGMDARRAAPWLLALSSFALLIFSELRMYGLLALAVVGLLGTVLDTLQDRVRGAWTAVWIALGLYSHYYFVHYGFVFTVTTLAVVVLRPECRRPALRLLLFGALGLVLFLPWGMTGFAEQLGHSRPSGGSSGLYLNLQGYVQSLAHLLFINASTAGPWMSNWVAVPGVLLAGILGLFGLLALWRHRGEDRGLTLTYLFVLSFVVPAWGICFALLYERAGYNWRYISGSCVPLLLVIAAGVRWRPLPRLLPFAGLLLTLSMLTGYSAVTAGQEDFRGSVRYILEHAEEGDAVITWPLREVNPDTAPTGWDYYRVRVERPEGAVEPTEYRVHDCRPAFEHDRIWLFYRYHYFPQDVLDELSVSHPQHTVIPMGPVIRVHRFAR